MQSVTVAACLLLGGAEAFKSSFASQPRSSNSQVFASKGKSSPPPAPESDLKSLALPWASRPTGLDIVELPGDRGFDPLNLAKSKEEILSYREAEIKHARLAMLAALGWPAGELFDGKLASKFGLPDLLVRPDGEGIGLEPSLLNGGLGTIPLGYWLFVVGLTSTLELKIEELKAQYKARGIERLPGDFGFDPLGFFPKDAEEQALMYEKEIKHGRIAMIAIVLFALEEFITRIPVVEENRLFFGLTPNEEIAEEEVVEVARESFSFLGFILKQLFSDRVVTGQNFDF